MKTNLKTLVIAAIAAITFCMAAPMASAQGGGMRMMGGGGGGLQLLQRKDVQKDLALTEKQIADLTALQEKMMGEMRDMFQNGGGGGDREAMMKKVQEMMATATKSADAILTPAQSNRLKEINVQMQGNRIITDPATQTKLKMTDEQKTKVKDLMTKQQEANTGLFEKMRNGEMQREELQAAMTKNNETMGVELGKILNDDQKKMLVDMAGKKFEKDPNEVVRGFGGGGGGR